MTKSKVRSQEYEISRQFINHVSFFASCSAAHLSCICGQEHCDWVYYTHDLFKRYAVIYEQIRQPPLESNKRTKERQVYCMERLRMDHHDDYNLTATSYAL